MLNGMKLHLNLIVEVLRLYHVVMCELTVDLLKVFRSYSFTNILDYYYIVNNLMNR